ncbi:DNA-primase RepB domain-containing protein [Acidithiobacillus ferriphilus]|jgi:hypothetical protein|uniref:DNA-primase RepB domain-containing protein n=1 Tax=Acidithiobacillus ferriphilus TaxID=1689834 RepID=UPI00243168BD|nr:DNA-primase RepB domain-containing protein [Acidithiobacillus ferriphilus]
MMAAEEVLTLSTDCPLQTPETPETADQFMRAIFGVPQDTVRPFVLAFHGDPATNRAWAGKLWDGNNVAQTRMNAYFTLSTFAPTETGITKRQGACFHSAFGVYLDDIGTKAAGIERLAGCPPSYLVETTPGNFHAGYLFHDPVEDLAALQELINALATAGLTDPGAKSPETRWGRLPWSRNNKPTAMCDVVLTEFHHDRRYSIAEMVSGLELDVLTKDRRRKAKAKNINAKAGGDDVYVPRADENPVISALKDAGLYKRPLGDGKHDITCPWADEHTDGIDEGTAYFEPDDTYPVGGFKCQHGHCSGHRVGDLLTHLDLGWSDARHRAVIRVEAGELHRVCDAAEKVLASSRRYYQRGGLVVSVGTDPSTNATTIRALKQAGLVRALAGAASWERYDGRSGDYVKADPPARHVAALFDAEDYRHLPALSGLAWQPFLRPDGSVCAAAGYDLGTRLYATFDASKFNIKTTPTKAEAQAAISLLSGLLEECQFADGHDRSAAIAGMLTAAIRPSLSTAPWFHIAAPVLGSGKSFMTDIIAAFASPQPSTAQAFPQNEEEARKMLLAALLEGPPVIRFDNLTTDLLPFKTLCSAVTDEFITDRVLGVSKVATVSTRTLLLSSGNNVGPVGDMTRRVLPIRLAPTVEIPAAIKYRRNPLAEVRADRGRYVSAALTIILAWILSGEKIECRQLNSFDQWTAWVRKPLLWLGQPDPGAALFRSMETDPEREGIARLYHAWWLVFQDVPIQARRLVQAAEESCADPDLLEALRDIAEERGVINRRRLGKWLARHVDRIVDGMTLRSVGEVGKTQNWQIKIAVTGVLGVSNGQSTKSITIEKDDDRVDL